MAKKGKKSGPKVFKQRKKLESNISKKRRSENNSYMNEALELKNEDKTRRTKSLREYLIKTYQLTKSRANDIAGRAVALYNQRNRAAA